MQICSATMSSVRPPRIFWPLMGMGIVLSVCGLVAFVFHSQHIDTGVELFYFAAPLAALLVGLPAWWHFVVKPRHATVPRGIVVGMLSSIAAHPVMAIVCVSFAPTSGTLSQWLLYVGLITLGSLIFAGWITIPLGGVMGLLLIYFQRALTHASLAQTCRNAEGMLWYERSSVEWVQEGKCAEKYPHDYMSECEDE
jgi:hypothetical protein